MKTVQTKIYQINELSEEAQEVAMSDWLDNGDIDLDYLIEDFKSELADYGFTSVEIECSGFWSQGDGASFTGFLNSVKDFLVKNRKHALAKKIKNLDEVSMHVTRHNHQYSHERTVGVCLNDILDSDDSTELEKYLDAWVEDYSLDMYKRLQEEYEYETSDERIIENMEANDATFTANGKYWVQR